MFKKLFFAATVVLFLVACKSNEAFEINQEIAKKEKALEADIKRTEDAVGRFILAGEYDSMAAVSTQMVKIIDNTLEEIKEMKWSGVKEGDSFKSETLRYFGFMKSLYAGYVEYGNAGTDEARDEKMDEIKKIVEQRMEVAGDMQRAQRSFAEANGFKLKQ